MSKDKIRNKVKRQTSLGKNIINKYERPSVNQLLQIHKKKTSMHRRENVYVTNNNIQICST